MDIREQKMWPHEKRSAVLEYKTNRAVRQHCREVAARRERALENNRTLQLYIGYSYYRSEPTWYWRTQKHFSLLSTFAFQMCYFIKNFFHVHKDPPLSYRFYYITTTLFNSKPLNLGTETEPPLWHRRTYDLCFYIDVVFIFQFLCICCGTNV